MMTYITNAKGSLYPCSKEQGIRSPFEPEEKVNKEKCLGCTDDFYNGKNGLGIKECCRLGTATVIMRKKVPLDQRPPWTQKAIKVPSCYRQSGFVFVGADRTC